MFRGPGSGEPPEPWLIRHWSLFKCLLSL